MESMKKDCNNRWRNDDESSKLVAPSARHKQRPAKSAVTAEVKDYVKGWSGQNCNGWSAFSKVARLTRGVTWGVGWDFHRKYTYLTTTTSLKPLIMTSFALRSLMLSAAAAPSAATRFFSTGQCSRGPQRWRLYSQRLTARWRALPRPRMSVTARWSRRKKAIVFYTTIAGTVAISETALRLPEKVGPIYKYDCSWEVCVSY